MAPGLPDVILLGEVRSRGVLKQALALAETGHLVFTTRVHGKTAPDGLEAETRRQVAGVIRAVNAQALVPSGMDSA